MYTYVLPVEPLSYSCGDELKEGRCHFPRIASMSLINIQIESLRKHLSINNQSEKRDYYHWCPCQRLP